MADRMGPGVPGRGIFVAGASSGIGAAVAVEWARAGYVVAGASRRGTVPTAEGKLTPVRLDVTDHGAMAAAVDDFAAASGGLAGVVHCAGYQEFTPSAELSMDGLRAVLETNLVSAVRLAQLARPHLADHGGFVAFIGSFYADLGVPGSLAYSASKAALASVTRTLAVEWAAAGIAVVNFAPGYVETELNADYLADPDNRARIERRIPVGRVGTAAEIGRLIVAVLTADCRFLTGETITIDGAQGRRL